MYDNQIPEWERDLSGYLDAYLDDPTYHSTHPNNVAYARSQEDHMYDDDDDPNHLPWHPQEIRKADPTFVALRPILRYLPDVHTDPFNVIDVESLADFLLAYSQSGNDALAAARESVNTYRRDLYAAQDRAHALDTENRKLHAQIEFAQKYPGQTVQEVVYKIALDHGLGTANFKFIQAIKDVRTRLNNGLKEAKDLVDEAKAQYEKTRVRYLIDPNAPTTDAPVDLSKPE